MRLPALLAACFCVFFGMSLIGYAIFAPYAPAEAALTSCPDGMALTSGFGKRSVCIRGVTLPANADAICPEAHVALEGVSGRTICTPGVEAPASQPG
jgi:hypothetical protein